ncbi:MAG TPA: peptidoglycan-binding protein [Bryobacterales bacterium]|jgi:putative chitinase|nr:peptidoglycan-binding protein [Bryobacterales bacterium]
MRTLAPGAVGADVSLLQLQLQKLGLYSGPVDGSFGPATCDAVRNFQKNLGLAVDGVAGPRTVLALGLTGGRQPLAIPGVTFAVVLRMFPFAPAANIEANLPPVLSALVKPGLTDKSMILMALSTIRAETEAFEPVSETESACNTSPGGRPFDLYENRPDLGNVAPGDGARYRGRGFVQLTGRINYQQHGAAIGLGDRLTLEPELANDPEIAARLLASFLKKREARIRGALGSGELAKARQFVNGGSNGLGRFVEAYSIGEKLIPDELA